MTTVLRVWLMPAAFLLTAIFVCCCGVMTTVGFLDLPTALLVGWYSFLSRVLPRVTINWSGFATAIICLGGLVVGGDRFARWFVARLPRNQPSATTARWKFSHTVRLVALVVVAFTAGVAVVGMVHQTAWLFTDPRPILRRAPPKTFPDLPLQEEP